MEQTELQKKHAFSTDFFSKLFFFPIEYKCSILKEEYKKANDCLSESISDEEKELITQKIKWLSDTLVKVEKALEKNCHNRRYEPLEIPNVIN